MLSRGLLRTFVHCLKTKEHENYQYDWKYNTAPKDKKQEQKQSEDFINALAEKTFQAGVTISLALPAYANQAIHFASDDIGGDMGMMIALLYILIAIMAFVFSVTIRHTITRESAVIGTLRASGYTKGDTDLRTDCKSCLSNLVIERNHL